MGICVGLLLVFLIVVVMNIYKCPPEPSITKIKLEQPEFFLKDTVTKDVLIEALEYYDIKYPEIVCAQAILETGNFKSKVFKEYNNLFGLYNSYTKDYYKFNHWTESIEAYKSKIEYRYKEEEDYYTFLTRIGYAEDPLYTSKVKKIINNFIYD